MLWSRCTALALLQALPRCFCHEALAADALTTVELERRGPARSTAYRPTGMLQNDPMLPALLAAEDFSRDAVHTKTCNARSATCNRHGAAVQQDRERSRLQSHGTRRLATRCARAEAALPCAFQPHSPLMRAELRICPQLLPHAARVASDCIQPGPLLASHESEHEHAQELRPDALFTFLPEPTQFLRRACSIPAKFE